MNDNDYIAYSKRFSEEEYPKLHAKYDWISGMGYGNINRDIQLNVSTQEHKAECEINRTRFGIPFDYHGVPISFMAATFHTASGPLKDFRLIAEKLCSTAPKEMSTLVNKLEVEQKANKDKLISEFIKACRDNDYLGDDCGE